MTLKGEKRELKEDFFDFNWNRQKDFQSFKAFIHDFLFPFIGTNFIKQL